MRMYPPSPADSTSSDAERRVFDLLTATELNDAVGLHSLTLTEHEYKAVAEADFVIVSRRGVLVLEVKGGGVSCTDGIWVYEDRHGERHKSSEGPFKQAQTAMYALQSRLKASDPGAAEGVLFGFGVVTPNCRLNVDATEWDDTTLIDFPRLAGRSDLAAPLSKLYSHWGNRFPRTKPIPTDRVNRIRQLLRPDFEKVPPLGARSVALSGRMLSLTESQYSVLDYVASHERVLVAGGAGTGKTLVAVEAARRESAAGRRVALIVESPILAAYLRSRTPSEVRVLALRELSVAEGRFDVLVIDEAQDMMTVEVLDTLDGLVEGTLLGSRWRVFYDVNNQAGVRGRFEPGALELLMQSASGPPLDLSRNCRNTSEIVRQTQLTTGADLGVAMAGEGPPVDFLRVATHLECAEAVETRLSSLIEEEYVDPASITILTDTGLDGCLAHLPKRWRRRLVPVDAAVAADWPPTNVSVSTVADFKGLENDFILLVDLSTEKALADQVSVLYVGMSRARAGLWIAVPTAAWDALAELQTANLATVVGDA
jgi:hypothetical protein